MRVLLFGAPALALALLGAHFFRDGAWPFTLLCIALIGLLAFRRRWVPWVLQAALAAGALEWAWTAFVLVQERIALGRPWTRLALILGIVALFTAASAFAVGRLRAWYRTHR